MKHLRLLLVCIPFLSMSCSKSGGTTTTPPVTPPVTVVAEADIAFKLEADGKEIDYAAIYAASGLGDWRSVSATLVAALDDMRLRRRPQSRTKR